VHNPGATAFPARLYLLLDVFGFYYFWPSWLQQEDFLRIDVAPGSTPYNALDFAWPDVSDGATGIKFWAALLDLYNPRLIGSYSMVEWGYGP